MKIRVALIGQFNMRHKASIEIEIRELTVTHTFYGRCTGDTVFAEDDQGRKTWICHEEDENRHLRYECFRPHEGKGPLIGIDERYRGPSDMVNKS